ncbi:acyl carrier protein [Streptomyces sp. Da 82-17]|uniref:acyl carrier protein n=1 Tax=Streptomyces sp. Da 82-17 TaxID=3377116 RepID=UPI0038D36F60
MAADTLTDSGAVHTDAGPDSGAVDCRLFDCIQVNLALLADRWHGPGTSLYAGAALRFRPVPGPGGLPTVEEPTSGQLDRTARALGLVVRDRHGVGPGEELTAAEGRYVVADAWHLPWVPYFGHRHMDHSFLLEPADGGAVVVDGYHNETPWGSARPVRRPISADDLAAAVPAGALAVTLAPAAAPAGAEPELDFADAESRARYVAAYAEHDDRVAALDRLTLETWLLARSRRLHAAFRARTGTLPEGAEDHVRAWESLAESVYVGYRRAERGRPEPRDLYVRLADRLDRDLDVFGAAAVRMPEPAADAPTAPATAPAALREQVAAAAGTVLRADPAALLDGRALADMPGYTSFRVVEIVERLERELSLEFAADDLVPENLHHVDGLCRIVLRARSASTAADARTGTRTVARTGGN